MAEDAFAIVGTSLTAFLRHRSAYYLMLVDQNDQALDMLCVPTNLRATDPDDETLARIVRWSDPELPHFSMDPYAESWTAEVIREYMRARQ